MAGITGIKMQAKKITECFNFLFSARIHRKSMVQTSFFESAFCTEERLQYRIQETTEMWKQGKEFHNKWKFL